MADQTPDLSQLVRSIPQIVITEPSPFREGAATETSTAISTPAIESAVKTSTSPGVDVPASGDDSRQESDDFQDPDCELSEEQLRRNAEVVLEVAEQLSERERNEEDVFRNATMENCFGRCIGAIANFSESKYMLIVLFLLLALPISAGFMGAKYLDKCPLSNETPIFLFMMGIAGMIVIISKFLLISHKILLPEHREWQMPKVIIIVGNLAIIVCLATEMFSFLRTSPSFEMGSAHYCHRKFYRYTYWANWTSVIVIVFLMILQLPNCSVVTP